jgi:hypothetical protein
LHKIAAAEEKAKTRAKEQGLEFSEEAFYQDYFGEEAQLAADALGIELSTLINNIKQNIESANSRILV